MSNPTPESPPPCFSPYMAWMPTLFLNEVAGNSWFGNAMKKP